jgi:hypothetical protein
LRLQFAGTSLVSLRYDHGTYNQKTGCGAYGFSGEHGVLDPE